QRMHSGCIDGVNGVNTRHHAWNDGAGQLVNQIAEASIFLRRTADDREWPNRARTMIDALHTQHRKIMDQAVVAEMIAERPFWQQSLRIDGAANAEVRLGRYR